MTQSKFPLSKEEWYRARDDRTRRVDNCEGFERFRAGILVGKQAISGFPVQLMAYLTLNILARWCRSITIQMPERIQSQLPIGSNADFSDFLGKTVSEIDPYCEFEFKEVRKNDSDVIMGIGELDNNFRDAVWIDGSGWVGGISVGEPHNSIKIENESRNPVGPAFASCVGAAEVFRRAVGLGESRPQSVWYSLFDFSSSSDPRKLINPSFDERFDLGRIYQIGCGAVASSLDALLALTDWSGEVELIDYDRLDASNCNRSLSFQALECVSKENKTDACAHVLGNGKFKPSIFNCSYSRFIDEGNYPKIPPDIILCLANEQNVWSTIQNNFPPLVLHATTTPSWGTNFGRHLPIKDWCLLCRFGKELNHQFVPNCGEGQLFSSSNESPPIEGVLPFLPAGASVILLSELAKLSQNQYPINCNMVNFSFRQPKGQFVQVQKQPIEDCLCREQTPDLYPGQIKASKYWNLILS